MDGLELIAFQIIASVGNARSLFIEAIRSARAGDFDGADKLVKEGETSFAEGHHAHADLIAKEAEMLEAGKGGVNPTLLLTHAEDQLMSAESFKILSSEFIETYKLLAEKNILDK